MKTTYTFIRDLMSLLKRGNWQQDLYNRNNQINQELEILPEQCNQEIRRMKIRWKELGSKGRTITSQEKQAELCLKKLARYTELEQKLLQEQLDIEYCLNVNQYKIGIGVFQNAQDASMLLANIHLLYSKEFSADFNPNTLSAVKSMLKANFDKLYTKEVDQSFSELNNYFFREMNVEKFLSGKINSSSTIQDLFPKYDNCPKETQQLMENYFNSMIRLNYELVLYSYEKFNPIMKLYASIVPRENWDFIILKLSAYFSSTQDIDHYLEKEVDFSSFSALENSVMLDGDNLDISKLSPIEIGIWHQLNARFGKKAIKLFGRANDLQKIMDISTAKTIAECAVDNSSNSLDILFRMVQASIQKISYERAQENGELAQLSQKYNINEDVFNRILDTILPYQKSNDFLPDVQLNIGKKGEYLFEKLPANALEGLFLGKMTACCQFIGGDAEECVIDGFTKESAGFYVLRNEKYNIQAQSYAWIGENNIGESVLVLDSFEYLSGLEKYFVDIVQGLLEAIQGQGFTELYVGTGGKTPKLDYHDKHVIAAKDSELCRYLDSQWLYKIDTNPKLVEFDTVSQWMPKYTTFFELVKYNPYLSYEQIKAMDKNGDIQKLNEKSHTAISVNSIILNMLLSDRSITMEQLIKLFTISDDNYAIEVYTFNQGLQFVLEEWNFALQYYTNDFDYRTLMDIIHHRYALSPYIIELFGNKLPWKALTIIEEYLDSNTIFELNNALATTSTNLYENSPIIEVLGDITLDNT